MPPAIEQKFVMRFSYKADSVKGFDIPLEATNRTMAWNEAVALVHNHDERLPGNWDAYTIIEVSNG